MTYRLGVDVGGTFTDILLEAVGKATAGRDFNFDKMEILGFQTIGPFLTALVAFIIMAAVVYFGVVKPYQAMRERMRQQGGGRFGGGGGPPGGF